MNNRKFQKIFIWISSFLFIIPRLESSKNKSQLIQLQVRTFNGEKTISSLNKNNFKLIINNIPRQITSLHYQQKSLRVPPELGRHIIISFQATEFNKRLKRRISHLVAEILTNRDTLYVISPVRIYQFKTYPNKERMIREIHSLLENDFSKQQKEKTTFEKNLTNKINRINQVYSGSQLAPGPYLETVGFLNNFPAEFFRYNRNFLSPAIDKYKQVIKLLQTKEGERWLIHFHDFKIYDIFLKTIGITKKIYGYIHSQNWQHQAMGLSLAGKLMQFRKHLSVVKFYPTDSLMTTILNGHINYNVVFFSGTKDIDLKTPNKIFSDLEGVLNQVAKNSGGVAVYLKNNLQEMKTIKNHQDFFYNLNFSFNRKIEAKKIQLIPKDQNQIYLYYRNFLPKEEVKNLIKYFQEKKVKITDLSINNRSIRFMVKSFDLKSTKNSAEIYGLLKIIIQVLDQNRFKIFESKKTLRATKKELAISLSVPGQQSGTFNLYLSVVDLIANSQSTANRVITLK
jgi:hypothetical protein